MSTPESPTPAPATTHRLATWAADLAADDVPQQVRDQTCRLLLDGLGAGLFGTTTRWADIVGELVLAAGGAPEATVWGSATKVPATQAPLANGTFMHSFEFDDLHAAAVIHGGAQVIPAALAVAEQRAGVAAPPTAAEFLVACVAGLEVGARVGLATGSRQLSRGFHPSPNTGLFSAALTAGLLLRLDTDQLAQAIGIAASSGGFLMGAQYGAMVKRMHPGRAAQAGVLAAQLAGRGFTGVPAALEQPYGGFAHAYAAVGPEVLSSVTEGLGEHWETLRFSVKAYPCCGSNHTSVDAYRAILDREPGLRAEHIESIEVECSTLTAEHVGWPYTPDSVTAAQMNLPFTLAVFAVDRTLFVEQFAEERIADPQVLDLVGRVRILAREDIDAEGRENRHHVRLTVTTKEGTRLSEEVRHARGSAHRPLSEEECREKYRRLAVHVLDDGGVAELEKAVDDLRTASTDATPVHRLLDCISGAVASHLTST